jgi:hypothetical protein
LSVQIIITVIVAKRIYGLDNVRVNSFARSGRRTDGGAGCVPGHVDQI